MFYTAKHLVFGFNIILIILLLGTTLGASLSYGQPLEASIFTLTYDDEHIPYSYSDLTNLETYSGLGGRLNVLGEVVGPFEYTGVHISTLLDQIPDAPAVANIVVISSDGYV